LQVAPENFENNTLTIKTIRVQWSDKAAYKETLLKLAGLFKNNFEVFASYKIGDDNSLTDEILAAGPNF
jgi:ATP-dependent phosphoenolpyruvate carboxykinase